MSPFRRAESRTAQYRNRYRSRFARPQLTPTHPTSYSQLESIFQVGIVGRQHWGPLSQGGTPLIIDQPEDDLDSATALQIVSKIWQSKSRRQLIFSSHNANLVVNGDADLVLVCAYLNAGDQSAGHIKREGVIDVALVRDEITSVMEGGERAFRLRKEKYGF
jgi:hypothetical protein